MRILILKNPIAIHKTNNNKGNCNKKHPAPAGAFSQSPLAEALDFMRYHYQVDKYVKTNRNETLCPDLTTDAQHPRDSARAKH